MEKKVSVIAVIGHYLPKNLTISHFRGPEEGETVLTGEPFVQPLTSIVV